MEDPKHLPVHIQLSRLAHLGHIRDLRGANGITLSDGQYYTAISSLPYYHEGKEELFGPGRARARCHRLSWFEPAVGARGRFDERRAVVYVSDTPFAAAYRLCAGPFPDEFDLVAMGRRWSDGALVPSALTMMPPVVGRHDGREYVRLIDLAGHLRMDVFGVVDRYLPFIRFADLLVSKHLERFEPQTLISGMHDPWWKGTHRVHGQGRLWVPRRSFAGTVLALHDLGWNDGRLPAPSLPPALSVAEGPPVEDEDIVIFTRPAPPVPAHIESEIEWRG
jgi:hypothetical protein